MYWVNKVVGALVNPVYAGLIVLAVAFACTLVRRRKAAKWLLGVTLGWLWLCSMPATTRMLGVTLERGCLLDGSVPSIGSYPESDAIELHGLSLIHMTLPTIYSV